MLRKIPIILVIAATVCAGCGPGGDAYEPDDSMDEASEIALGESQTRTFHDEQDVDYVRFTASAGTAYVAYIDLTGSDMDSILSLLGPDGTLLAENDDIEDPDYFGLESRLYWTAPDSGDYYLLAETWSDAELGTYYLTLELNDLFDLYESDNTLEDAKEIVPGEVQERSFHEIQDVDYIRFTADAAALYEFYTTIPEGELTDTYLTLLDAKGTQLAFNDDENSFSVSSRIRWLAPSSGEYYIAAACKYTGSYMIGLEDISYLIEEVSNVLDQFEAVAPDVFEPDDTLEQASASKLGIPQERTLHLDLSGVDQDYIRFEAVEDGEYTLSATIPEGASTDVLVQILDWEGKLLTEIDGGDAGEGEQGFFVAPAAGFYYLHVVAYSRETYGPYTLLLDGPGAQ